MKRILLISVLVAAVLATGIIVNAQTPYIAWKVQYYDNPILLDPPVKERTVTEINNEWFFSAPEKLPVDNFSIRYGSDVFFNAGTYRFTIEADDQVRLSIDNKSIIDTFAGGQSSQPIVRDVALSGSHHLQIDYRELTGVALLKVKIENVADIGKPAPGQAAATVRVATLNVRQQPTTDSTILTKINLGQTYRVLAANSDASWYRIDVNGLQGWVYAPLVIVTNTGAVVTVTPTPVVVGGNTNPTGYTATTQANLRLRSTPRISNNTLTTLPSGTTVPILARNADADWFKVNFNGRIGWIYYQFIAANPPLVLDQIPVE